MGAREQGNGTARSRNAQARLVLAAERVAKALDLLREDIDATTGGHCEQVRGAREYLIRGGSELRNALAILERLNYTDGTVR